MLAKHFDYLTNFVKENTVRDGTAYKIVAPKVENSRLRTEERLTWIEALLEDIAKKFNKGYKGAFKEVKTTTNVLRETVWMSVLEKVTKETGFYYNLFVDIVKNYYNKQPSLTQWLVPDTEISFEIKSYSKAEQKSLKK